ncbi:hypothetical protein IB267_10690 [Ensifer sp. ENS09]|uniref:hypothetical protein n=1 Tax=Ensifer sp. ENS09 TaxID=2769263 RepID=UPI00177AF131|nr:hypothetical protein [Ensifer sp. ENS09]MBD9648819.1 hypothetical protein [Ensifer sp. ENS09]
MDELYATTEASFRDEVSRQEFSERYSETRFVVARRDAKLAGWLSLRPPIEGDDERAADRGWHAMPSHDLQNAEILAQLFRLAAVEVGSEGIIWHSRTTPLNQQVVEMTGATALRDLFRTWQAPSERWPAAIAKPKDDAVVYAVHAPLPEDLLAKFVDFLTRAGISDCSGETCTTTWDADAVAQRIADWDEGGLLMQWLEHHDLVVAEAYAFVWNDEMMIHITEHQASSPGLIALVATLLQRIPAAYPDIRVATVELQEDERAGLEPVLTSCGFEDKGPRTLFHLRPEGAPVL